MPDFAKRKRWLAENAMQTVTIQSPQAFMKRGKTTSGFAVEEIAPVRAAIHVLRHFSEPGAQEYAIAGPPHERVQDSGPSLAEPHG
jgi:hypothetical protein